jgi:acyl-CoA synthetase (NDP forming)
MASDLSPSDLALVIRAAQSAGLNPSKLKAANPWSFEGPMALSLQSAVVELDPAAAERLQDAAGVRLSLGAAAALEGLTEWSPELEQELETKRPETFQRLRSEAMEAAAQQAFSGWHQEETEALELARQYGYNSARLLADGHSLAARKAAEHLEQQQRQQQQEIQASTAWARGLS